MLVAVLFAAVVYGGFWLLERRGRKRGKRKPAMGTHPAPPRRSVAPDDDEDFLRELERRRRRAAREKQARDSGKPKRPAEDDEKPKRDQSSPE